MPGPRRQGRTFALQLLYQLEMNPDRSEAAVEGFWAEAHAGRRARAFATGLVEAVQAHREAIDGRIRDTLEHWRLERLSVAVRNVLRLAVAELLYLREVPPAVVIDEAVSLAAEYGEPDAGRIVNGVLDRIRQSEALPPDAQAPPGP